MTSRKSFFKKLLEKNNRFLLILIVLITIIFINGIENAFAYYHKTITSGVLANKVGDFDSGDGDANIVIYRENDQGQFIRVYAIPTLYYKFNPGLTSCTIPCNGQNDNCQYSYDSANNQFTVTSNQKVTCKFYFEQEASTDIEVYILVEDENGAYSYNSKTYSEIENIPAYGYKYSGNYRCDNASAIKSFVYNGETRKFQVQTTAENKCYAYFDKESSADIIATIYIQATYDSEIYNEVTSVPSNKIYTLNTTMSLCTPQQEGAEAGVITYTDGYINIDASTPQVCSVYLDLESNSTT